MKNLITTFVVLGMILVVTGTARADFVYAVTFDDELLSINTATGAGTLIGNLDSSMNAFGLANRGMSIYTFDQEADRIRQLDPTTGSTLATIDIGVATIGEGGIAFRSDGIGFMSTGGSGLLWSFDITVPSSTAITTTGGLVPSMDGLDFDASDILYGISQYTYSLYTINQATGATTLVGSTGLTNSGEPLAGLTFTSDGTLYAVINDSLYNLNPGTGAASLVGAIGFDNVSGLTACPIPAPGAILLGSMGVGLVGWLRRRRTL